MQFHIRNSNAVALSFGVVVLTLTLWSSVCFACTVVRYSIDGHLIVTRNHDWPFGEGALIVNQRGIEKASLSPLNPARCVSKYGSVSLVQFGREIPFAGMNERGLTVDLLGLPEAKFPGPNSSVKTVNVVQWVQYQLDTAATVEEVIATLENIVPMPMLDAIERVHYFITDPGHSETANRFCFFDTRPRRAGQSDPVATGLRTGRAKAMVPHSQSSSTAMDRFG